jgi:Homeobox KN domain
MWFPCNDAELGLGLVIDDIDNLMNGHLLDLDEDDQAVQSPAKKRKRRGKAMCATTKAALIDWFNKNWDDPYPDNSVKQSLCRQLSLSAKELNNW